MTTEPETRTPKPESRRSAKRPRLGGLFAEFAKLSPSLDWECTEREARLRWVSEVLRKPVASWNLLSQNEVNRCIKVARRQSGNSPLNDYIPEAAVELWGSEWDSFLAGRLKERFGEPRVASLEPREKAAIFEELCSRLGRRDGRKIEEVKVRIMARIRHRGTKARRNRDERVAQTSVSAVCAPLTEPVETPRRSVST